MPPTTDIDRPVFGPEPSFGTARVARWVIIGSTTVDLPEGFEGVFRIIDNSRVWAGQASAYLREIVESLDEDDRAAFRADIESASTESSETFERTLQEWLTTARVLRDPLSRELLLGNIGVSDFIEVDRPA